MDLASFRALANSEKKQCEELLEIKKLLFRRYLNEIRCCFVNFNIDEEVVFGR